MKVLRTCLPIAALAVGALWPSTADATWPGKPGLVAYQGKNGIETVRPDGTHHRVVFRNAAGNTFAWSPNGRELASAAGWVWRMRADGSHRRVVVKSGFGEPARTTEAVSPSWSPQGDRLVFTASSTWSDPDDETQPRTVNWIWSVRRDGTHLRRLVRGTGAVWSRSGARIRFVDVDYGVAEIKADGTGVRVLAHNPNKNTDYTHGLDLAPGGERLVYQTDSGWPGETITWTLNVRSRARTGFSLGTLGVGDVVWAPGGKRLAYPFYSPGRKRFELRTIRPDGHDVRRVLTFPGHYPVGPIAWQTRPR
jgi:dipeptidyl aminopeptidase/acylaminoacyl peptidase